MQPVTAARNLGPYELLARVGEGGMGQVFRARDTRLDRIVAIKVLSPGIDSRRLDQEARAISGLSHPNICTLFDVGSHEQTDYLVMEYLDGETLAQRLKRAPLSTEEAQQFASEIADALEAAHRRGIIHRDLKPGNIMLVKSSKRVTSKLLDFGLARSVAREENDVQGTGTLPLTSTGVVVGTPRYMAPEQVQGRPADARSDIYAFGLVLEEMLGKSEAPPAVCEIVKRCLAREPAERWQSAGDVRAALDLVQAAPRPAVQRKNNLIGWIVAGLALIAAAALLWWRWEPRTIRESVVFPLSAPPKHKLAGWPGVPSPDGRRIALLAQDEAGNVALWMRELGSQQPRRLDGTDGAAGPFWSPDGQFLGFFASGKLKRIPLAGGPAQNICNAITDLGATWSPSGDIVFAPVNRTTLHRVRASGGVPEPITTLDSKRQENSHRWPYFLPDGRHFVFTARSSVKENTGIYVGSLDSKETKWLFSAQSGAKYSPPGYLLFGTEGTLMAREFDVNRLELKGEPFPIIGDVEHVTPSASALFAVSNDGSVLSVRRTMPKTTRLSWFDRSGIRREDVGPAGVFTQPALSPDQKQVAIVQPDSESGNRDIWLMNVASGALTRFTFNPANDWCPLWTPEGNAIVFASDRTAKSSIFRKPLSGGDEEMLLTGGKDRGMFPTDLSRNGELLMFQEEGGPAGLDLGLLPLAGARKPHTFLATEFREYSATFSPDGRWVAYLSNESGTSELYASSLSGHRKVRISTAGAQHAVWRRDGRELFYDSPDGWLMAVAFKSDESFESAAPKALFRTCAAAQTLRGSEKYYDVSPDGSKFLIACVAEEARQYEIAVHVGWQQMLKRGTQ